MKNLDGLSSLSNYLIQGIAEPALLTDDEMNILRINSAALKLTGFTSEEALKMKCHEIFKKSGASCANNCYVQALPEGELSISNVERTIQNRQGTEIPTRANIGRIKDDLGNTVGCIEIIRDISDISEMEQQIEEALLNVTNEMQKSNAILSGIPDPTFMIDNDMNITFFNHAAEILTGYPNEAAIGKKCRKVLRADICKENCIFEVIKETGEIVSGIDATITNKQSKNIAAMCSASTLRDSEGNIIGAVEIVKDMTEIKTLVRDQEEIKNYLQDQVDKLLTVVTRAAAGDLTVEAVKERDDSIGELVDGINNMTSNLRDLVREIQNTSGAVATTSQDLASSAEEMNASTQQVSSAIQQISKGAQSQASQVEDSAKVTKEMSDSVDEVVKRAEASVKSSMEANESVDVGRKTVEETVSKMTEIQKVVVDSAGVIKNLGDRSKEISEIVDVITNITDQTNLLALNAAIEAARAGEQGRGFAVVADEVKNLAEDSRDAAKRISKMINEIQNVIEKAVTSMNEGTKEVEGGMEMVRKTDATFQTIAQANQKVNSEIEAISAASQQQMSGTEMVAKSIDSIASIAEETASASVESASATEELTASMEEMTSRAQELSEMAFALQNSAIRFKLSEDDAKPDTKKNNLDSQITSLGNSGTNADLPKPRTPPKAKPKLPKKVAESLKKRGKT